MKNSWILSGRWLLCALAMIGVGGLLGSCKKDTGASVQIPAAGVMVFNLAPDQPVVGVALSGNLLPGGPFRYTGYNGFYQPIYTGNREISIYANSWDSALARSSFTFQDSTEYSMFVIGNKGVYTSVVARDDVDTAAATDRAFIRYVNAIADSTAPVVTLAVGGAAVSSDLTPFGHVSAFRPVSPGDLSLTISNEKTIAANRIIPLEKGKVYTALLVGDPAATDSLRKVQIRYVVNGQIASAALHP